MTTVTKLSHAPQVEGEVELPRAAAALGELALLVREGQAELDHLEHVHVAPVSFRFVVDDDDHGLFGFVVDTVSSGSVECTKLVALGL